MSFHPSWPTFRPRVRSKYLHRLSDTTLLHTCIQLPGGLKHSIEFLQHWKGVCATVFKNTIALKKANVLTKCHLSWMRSYWIFERSSMLLKRNYQSTGYSNISLLLVLLQMQTSFAFIFGNWGGVLFRQIHAHCNIILQYHQCQNFRHHL